MELSLIHIDFLCQKFIVEFLLRVAPNFKHKFANLIKQIYNLFPAQYSLPLQHIFPQILLIFNSGSPNKNIIVIFESKSMTEDRSI